MSKTYKHVFFDLDHTLWDYETNAKQTLIELFDKYELDQYGIKSGQSFYDAFSKVNDQLWDLFNVGKITKFELRDRRFRETFERSGAIMKLIPTDLLSSIGSVFIKECSKKSVTFEGAKEILEYLQPKYPLHIITNGFEETQSIKLKSSGLLHFFDQIITSEKAGFKKPFSGIFTYAMKHANAVPEGSIMIGDNLMTDIKGARDFKIDTIYFNPENKAHKHEVTYEVKSLIEIQNIL
ncbi:YjjG family noncanonical pyrimidine nucleotidase [Reichenbachiella versicolor]|uniref:YjjG family noncanonical pyrimidine nucleotidase n=1 Tax=Reichenbachiella versicolor TaxID=1821036 RepID=UPI000D6E6211|nr:YjjG family noncanonical pyrimidine nucleotidase [Reichenbachiella versicolor]